MSTNQQSFEFRPASETCFCCDIKWVTADGSSLQSNNREEKVFNHLLKSLIPDALRHKGGMLQYYTFSPCNILFFKDTV